jgi:hypothetical protein
VTTDSDFDEHRSGATLTPSGPQRDQREDQAAVRLRQAMAVPHPRQACQTQRRTAAGAPPAPVRPPHRPARTHQPHRLDRIAVGSLDHDPPPSRPPRPAGGPWPVRLVCGCGLTPARARRSLCAPIRRPCRARWGRPRPGWHRRALPARLAGGGEFGRGGGRGRVGGKPSQHRGDHLGLLLRKAAARLAAQQLHLVGEPWRPRSCPSTAAAALAWRCCPVGVARLLCSPADGCWRRRPCTSAELPGWWAVGVSHPILGRVSITLIRVFARPPRRRASSTEDDPVPSPQRGKVAVHGPRHRGPRIPRVGPGPTRGWLGSPCAACSPQPRLPPWWRRTGSITRRSPIVHAVSGSFIGRSPATRRRRRG